jgi:hypothetical protein
MVSFRMGASGMIRSGRDKMYNKRATHCVVCDGDLDPGAGRFWSDELPPWKKNGGRYMCGGCWDVATAWRDLVRRGRKDYEYIRWWILENGPRRTVRAWDPMGNPCWRDERGLAQDGVRAVLEGSGLLYHAVARRVAQTLTTALCVEWDPDSWEKVVDLAEDCRDQVETRVGMTMNWRTR